VQRDAADADPRHHLDRVVSIAQSIERFLSLSDDGAALTCSLSPDPDSFYWNDPGASAAADEIWGLAPKRRCRLPYTNGL
jgi:hypothetical protein